MAVAGAMVAQLQLLMGRFSFSDMPVRVEDAEEKEATFAWQSCDG